MKKRLLLTPLLLWSWAVFPQKGLSLKEAVQFGLAHHQNIKNSQLDLMASETRIKEIKSAGLPQVNSSLQMMGNPILQKVFLPAKFFNPQAADDAAPVAAKFGVNFSNNFSFSANQLIFDGSYLLGMKAAQLLSELNTKNVNATKVQVTEAITKAYYQTIVAEERIKLLDLNVNRLDSTIIEMKKLHEAGFIEKLDIDRLEVQRNNLQTERDKVANLINLSYALLKFQMGMDQADNIRCSDDLRQIDLKSLAISKAQDFSYQNRIEISQLETSKKLADLDIENKTRGYWPKVFGFGSLGFNQGTMKFNPFTKWFAFSAVGLQVQTPIWDSNLKKHQIQSAKIAVKKLENTQNYVKSTIDFQIQQANISLSNALKSLEVQERNVALAKSVLEITKKKYQNGAGTNLEVVNAEATLREAQTSYYASLFEAVLAKVDLDKALGNL